MANRSVDTLLRALADSRRRAVCRYFSDADHADAGVDELVEHVVRRERGREGASRTDHRRIVAVELRHVHLPMLADVGVIDFDGSTGTVHYNDDPDLERLVEEVCEADQMCA